MRLTPRVSRISVERGGARDYDPTVGRWISEDPIGLVPAPKPGAWWFDDRGTESAVSNTCHRPNRARICVAGLSRDPRIVVAGMAQQCRIPSLVGDGTTAQVGTERRATSLRSCRAAPTGSGAPLRAPRPARAPRRAPPGRSRSPPVRALPARIAHPSTERRVPSIRVGAGLPALTG